MERIQSNEPIVAQDKCVQSVGAKRGKIPGGTHLYDLKELFRHSKVDVVSYYKEPLLAVGNELVIYLGW